MFPKRRVNALTPIFASLNREKEDLSLPPKIPLSHVHNSIQQLQTCFVPTLKTIQLSAWLGQELKRYRKSRAQKQQPVPINAATPSGEPEPVFISPFASKAPPQADFSAFLADFFYDQLLFGEQIQAIADSYQVTLGLARPNAAGQQLLSSGYPCPRAEVPSRHFSTCGPTAGLLPLDAQYCAASSASHQQAVAQLLAQEAQLAELQLSTALLQNALQFGRMRKITQGMYAAIYAGQALHFSIQSPKYRVKNSQGEPIMVLASRQDNLPFTAPYSLSLIAARKNTPSEMLLQQGRLKQAVVNALNQAVSVKAGRALALFSAANLSEQQGAHQYLFFPRQTAKQLVIGQNQSLLLNALGEEGYLLAT